MNYNISVDFTESNSEIKTTLTNNPNNLNADFKNEVTQMINDDYRELKNKPKINGTVLEDNYNEVDPTVPNWAKSENKPEYDLDEVATEMSFADIKSVWDSVFK